MNISYFFWLALLIMVTLSLLMPHPFLVWFSGINILTFVLYGADKAAARKNRRRISERTLLLSGLLGGWPGALLGQRYFRHKTQKQPFKSWFLLSALINIILVSVVCWHWLF